MVYDLAGAKSFFVELGLELHDGLVEGGWLDRVVSAEFAMMGRRAVSQVTEPGNHPREEGRARESRSAGR